MALSPARLALLKHKSGLSQLENDAFMYTLLWGTVTLLGDPFVLSFLILGLVWLYFIVKEKYAVAKPFQRHRKILRKFIMVAIPSLAIVFAGSEVLKLLFQIPRPCIPCPAEGCNLYCPPTFSFPSGHVSTITAAVTAFCLISRKRKYLAFFSLTVLVALSRILLYVHTITDVVAGFLFGAAVTLVVWRFRERLPGWKE